jgi:hypothetical protein
LSTPSDAQPAPDAHPKHRRPWGWIAVCGVLLLVAAGFAIWAIGLQSDLDEQKAQTTQAQQQAKEASDSVDGLKNQLAGLRTRLEHVARDAASNDSTATLEQPDATPAPDDGGGAAATPEAAQPAATPEAAQPTSTP